MIKNIILTNNTMNNFPQSLNSVEAPSSRVIFDEILLLFIKLFFYFNKKY